MRSKPAANLSPESISDCLRRVFDAVQVDGAARDGGFTSRKRRITPLALIVACLSSLTTSNTEWLADIQPTLNTLIPRSVQYKPVHKHLSKDGFPRFVWELFEQALGHLLLPVLEAIPSEKLARFEDSRAHPASLTGRVALCGAAFVSRRKHREREKGLKEKAGDGPACRSRPWIHQALS